jgi:hypothetical protein
MLLFCPFCQSQKSTRSFILKEICSTLGSNPLGGPKHRQFSAGQIGAD